MTKYLEQMFGASPCPVTYCDKELTPLWRNAPALLRGDEMWRADGPLRTMWRDEGMRAALRRRGQLSLPRHRLPAGLASLSLTAAGEGILCVAGVEGGAVDAAAALSAYMRGALSSIFAFLPLLGRYCADEAGAENYLDEINRSCYKLLRVTENLSLHARLAADEAFPLSPCDISATVDAICTAADTVCKGLAIPLTWQVRPGICARVYEPLLCHTLTNLLLNAYTYTREHNAVTVTLTADGDSLRLLVADKGLGIQGDTLGHVFEPYYSRDPYGDGPVQGAGPGMGLGLAIARNAVELMGGHILLQSTFGQGTLAVVTLPLCPETPALASAPADYLLNRFSPVYLQLAEICRLPDVF